MSLPLPEKTNTRENISNRPLNNSEVTGKDILVSEIFDAYENWSQVELKHTLYGYMLLLLLLFLSHSNCFI